MGQIAPHCTSGDLIRSPLLEGLWEFKWAGARSPGVIAARTLLR
jgi:hypothetical protein